MLYCVSVCVMQLQATAEREVILRNMRAVMLPYQAEVVQVARVVRSKLQGRRLELIRLLTRPTVVGKSGRERRK